MINLIIIRFYQRIDNWWTYWGWYIIVFTSVHPLTLATSHQYGGSRDIEPEGHAVSIGSSSLCLSKVPENWTYGHSRLPSHTRNIFKLWSSLINTWGFFKHILKSPNPNINTYQNHQISRFIFSFFGCPNHFLMTCGREWPTRHLCRNVIHPAVRPTCCKSCSACWGDLKVSR